MRELAFRAVRAIDPQVDQAAALKRGIKRFGPAFTQAVKYARETQAAATCLADHERRVVALLTPSL